jgi:subtilase family serine protease
MQKLIICDVKIYINQIKKFKEVVTIKKQYLISSVLLILTCFLAITAVSGADSSTTNTLASGDNVATAEQNGPDLVVTNLTAPYGGAPGGHIIVPNTVKNQGNNASGSFYVTYYLTPNTNFNNKIELGSQYTPSNDYDGIFVAGKSKTYNTILKIPSTVAVGQYYVAAVIDSHKSVIETNENNNVLFSATKLKIQKVGPDLLVTSIAAPANGIRGRTITVSNTVKNQGNMATNGFYVNYYLTPAQNLNSRIYIGCRYIKSLAAGASNTNNTILSIPSTIAVGQYYIAAVADGTRLITEVNEANNNGYSAFKIKVQNGRDLLITGITAVASGIRGRTITVANSVKNQGNLATNGFYVTYYLTPAQNMNKRIKIGYRYIKSLAAGVTNTSNTKLTIPTTIAVGQYYIAAVADSTKLITEVNEANNNGYSRSKIIVTIDNTPPLVKSSKPANNAVGFSLTSPVIITFSENIMPGVNFSKIYIKNLTTGKLVALSKLTINGNTLTLKMKSSRLRNNLYQVYIPASAVKDLSGNNLKASYSYKFRTVK